MNIQTIFSHMFVKRGFFGLLAFAWGFMLGGSALMTALTYGLALVGVSHYIVMLCQFVALGMLLGISWGVMEIEYQQRDVTNTKSFGAAFLVALFFGIVAPAVYAIGAFVICREVLQKKAILTSDKPLPLNFATAASYADRVTVRRRRTGLTGFMQDLMDRSFLKLAH